MLRSSLHSACLCASSTARVEIRRHRTVHRWIKFQRWQDLVRDKEKHESEKEMQKRYLPGGFYYLTPEKPEHALPAKDPEDKSRRESGMLDFDFLASHTQMRYLDHSADNVRRYERYQAFLARQYDQRFIPERHLFLGPDLAAAHFLVHRDAAVKFVGDDAWYKKDGRNQYSLPGRRIPDLYLEAIDASNTELMFEGFENLADLRHVRMLRLAGCPHIGDWAMSRMTQFENTLEFLDLSGCTRISAKGLAGLRSLKKLRYLRLEGMDQVPDIAQTALLLEESIPGLQVIGLDYDQALDALEAQLRLMSHPRVVQDAKGNVHAEGDDGQLFYVSGKVDERSVVDDADKPLMLSVIRRDVPAMSEAELDELDRLSGGKLRHLLIGSPSGLSWTEEVERTLSFEAKWKAKKQIEVHPFMLPPTKLPSSKRDKQQQIEDEQQGQQKLTGGTT